MKLSDLDHVYVLHDEETDELYSRVGQKNPGVWATPQGASCALVRAKRWGQFKIKVLTLAKTPDAVPNSSGGRGWCEA